VRGIRILYRRFKRFMGSRFMVRDVGFHLELRPPEPLNLNL
jgi:hypothetical protein